MKYNIIKNPSKIVWALFFISVLTAVASNLLGAGFNTTENNLIVFSAFAFPFIAVLSHAIYILGIKRALFFLFLSAVTGTVFETIGVNFGLITGGTYTYNMAGPALAGVPLVIPMFWFVFIYSAYGLVNAIIAYRNGALPSPKTDGLKFLFLLILIDAILITMIDLIMDPVMVAWSEWSWTGGGIYYDIPTENFLGWFTIGLIVSGLFRTYEYYYPNKISIDNKRIHLIPVLGYFTIIFSFTLFSFTASIYSLTQLSIILYLPLIIVLLIIAGKISLAAVNTESQKDDIFPGQLEPERAKNYQSLPKDK
jgi:uncharacterized membrane protein